MTILPSWHIKVLGKWCESITVIQLICSSFSTSILDSKLYFTIKIGSIKLLHNMPPCTSQVPVGIHVNSDIWSHQFNDNHLKVNINKNKTLVVDYNAWNMNITAEALNSKVKILHTSFTQQHRSSQSAGWRWTTNIIVTNSVSNGKHVHRTSVPGRRCWMMARKVLWHYLNTSEWYKSLTFRIDTTQASRMNGLAKANTIKTLVYVTPTESSPFVCFTKHFIC